MSLAPRREEPIDLKNLPPVDGTVLAYRLVDRYRLTLALPWLKILLLVAGIFGSRIALDRYEAGGGDWLWHLVAGIASIALIIWLVVVLVVALRTKVAIPIPHRPLQQIFQGWDELTRRLMESPHSVAWRGGRIRERDHLFYGTIAGTQKAFLLALPLLMSHMHITGGTGAGKSHRVVLPLLTQILRRRRTSIVYLDLKGDRAAFFGLAIEARRTGLNFRWVSLEPRKSSYVFNFFGQRFLAALSLNERTQILLQGLGIDAGEGYGTAYFSAIQERLVKAVMELNPGIRSFRELYEVIKRPDVRLRVGMSQRDIENASHVVAVLSRLESIPSLNSTPDDAPESVLRASLDVHELLAAPEVAYFALPAALEPTSARIVALTFVQSLVAAARIYAGERVDVIVVIDEFQQVIARNFATILKQARDQRISIWMAHQSQSDLAAGDYDFTGAVQGNSAVKIVCSARDLAGRDYLARTSGETVRELRGSGTTETVSANGSSFGISDQRHETIVPRIDPDVINRVNQDDSLSIVDASPGTGFTRLRHPIIVRSVFHISKREFERRQALPWPRPNAYTVGGADEEPPTGAPAAGPAGPPARDAPETPECVQVTPLPAPANPPPPAAQAPDARRPRRRSARDEAAGLRQPAAENPASAQAGEMADYLRALLDEQQPPQEPRP